MDEVASVLSSGLQLHAICRTKVVSGRFRVYYTQDTYDTPFVTTFVIELSYSIARLAIIQENLIVRAYTSEEIAVVGVPHVLDKSVV